MRAIAFSDLHAHPHRFGGVIAEDGRHSRLSDCLRVLDQTREAANNYRASVRLFCGDMFHVRGKLTPSVINPVIEHFQRGGNTFRDFILVGNHDMENRESGEHAVRMLSPYATILEDYGFQRSEVNGELVDIGWVAYAPDVKALKERVKEVAAMARATREAGVPSFFLLHHGVDGAMPGIPDMGFTPMDLPHDSFDYILCGDYHKHAELIPSKAWMIGAPLQHSFGDIGQKRGWMAIDTETKAVEFVENTQAPKFIGWDGAEGEPAAGNFVRIRSEDQDDLKALAAKALADGALATNEELVRSIQAAKRADVMLSMTTKQLFKSWIDGEDEIAAAQKTRVTTLNDDILAAVGVS